MVNIDDIRSLPNNINAEKDALSCIFMESNWMASSILKQYHFFVPEYGKIYKAMQKCYKDGKEISVINISNNLPDSFDKDMLRDLASFSMTSSGFLDDQAIVIEQYNRRKIIEGAKSVIPLAYDQEANIEKVIQKADEISKCLESSEETHTLVSGSIETMMKYFDHKEQPTIETDMGYKFLSASLLGRRAGALYIVAGGTGQGKSTFALNLCIEALKRGHQCAFFSTEMPAHEIHTRMLSREARVPGWKIEKGREEIADAVVEATQKMGEWGAECNIYDTFSTVENLERLIAKEAGLGTEIIFIDYIQQVRVKGNNRNLAIGDMTTMLKTMAIRYGISIVGLSQLNRSSQDSTEPSLRDLRDSGSIEQDADVVMFVHGFDKHSHPTTSRISILKNRHGNQGYDDIVFDKRYFLFCDPDKYGLSLTKKK